MIQIHSLLGEVLIYRIGFPWYLERQVPLTSSVHFNHEPDTGLGLGTKTWAPSSSHALGRPGGWRWGGPVDGVWSIGSVSLSEGQRGTAPSIFDNAHAL